MPIVVDTSAVIAVASNEPLKRRLVDLTRGEVLSAPATLPWEIGNAVSAMFKRRRITLEQGLELLLQYRLIPVRLIDVDLDAAIRLSSQLGVYAYDAYVLQCARQLGQSVLSLDVGLCHAARQAGIGVVEVQK